MKSRKNAILIIKPSSLGDILQTIPSLWLLKNHYPKVPIHWLAKEEYVSFLQEIPEIEEVIPFPRKSFTLKGFPLWLPTFLNWVESWKGRYTIAMDFQGLFRSGLISYLSQAPIRIGFLKAREGASFFYTHPLKASKKDHAILQYASLLEGLGIFEKPVKEKKYLKVPLKYQQKVWRRFPQIRQKPLLLFCPFAQWPSKYYPFERWAWIFEKLSQTLPQYYLGVIGSSTHLKEWQVLSQKTRAPLLNFVGETSLWELGALLDQAKLVVSLETGPMHFAALLQKPIIAIFGPNRIHYVAPFCSKYWILQENIPCKGCEKRICPKGHQKCLKNLDPQKVFQKILFSLNSTSIQEL